MTWLRIVPSNLTTLQTDALSLAEPLLLAPAAATLFLGEPLLLAPAAARPSMPDPLPLAPDAAEPSVNFLCKQTFGRYTWIIDF